MTTPLKKLLSEFRDKTLTERDQGTSFENLIIQYFKTEPFYKEKYTHVLSYADWVDQYGEKINITSKKDTGIDLVAITDDNEFHALQEKNQQMTTLATYPTLNLIKEYQKHMQPSLVVACKDIYMTHTSDR